MTGFTITPRAEIEFPDSSWTLTLQRQDNDVVISLHWRDKAIPTHQLACTVEEFKLMIDTAGLV